MQKYLPLLHSCPLHKEPLTLVCLEQECEKRGLICTHCQYQSHQHPVRPVAALFSEIERDTQVNSIALLSQIDNIYSAIETQALAMHKISDQKLITEMIQRYYQYQCNKIRNMSTMAKKLINKEDLNSIEEINRFLFKYEFIEKNENPANSSNLQIFVKSILEGFRASLEELRENIKNGDSIERVLPIFVIDEEKNCKYYFNPEKKHTDISVVDKSKVQIKNGYTYRIALLDPPIHKQNAKFLKKKTCTFRATKINAMVGVGVVFRKKAEDLSYVFSAYSQHGCYFTANNGYTYNEFDSSFNSQVKNWTFTTNDLIKVTIDPKNKKIIYSKEGSDPFEYSYEEKNDLELNFGIMICSNGESIQVV